MWIFILKITWFLEGQVMIVSKFWMGGGTQMCVARGLKPQPISKDFSQNKPWFDHFFNFFCKLGPISKGFLPQKWLILQFFAILVKWDPLSRISLIKMGPCLRIFDEKLTHLGSTSLYALTCEYPPPLGVLNAQCQSRVYGLHNITMTDWLCGCPKDRSTWTAHGQM